MSAAEKHGGALTRSTAAEAPGGDLRLDLGHGPLDSGTDRLRERRVLIVGLDYAPTATPVAPYTTGIAEHLATLAAGVTVLTGLPERRDGGIAAPYRHGLRVPDPGWQSPEAPRVIRLRHALAEPRRPLRRAWHELTFFLAVLLGGRGVPADLVVAVTPSPGGAAAAAWLATRRRVPLVTIVQDVVAPAPAPARALGRLVNQLAERFVRRFETSALRRSAEVAVTSEAYRGAVLAAGVGPERLHLLPNWTRLRASGETRASARAALGWPVDRFTVVHAGPFGHRQDLATVIEASRLLAERAEERAAERAAEHGEEPGAQGGPELADHGSGRTGALSLPPGRGLAGTTPAPRPSQLHVVLAGDGPQRPALEQQAFALGTVHFLETPDDDTLPLVLAAADVLLVAERGPGSPSEPGQLAAYLAAGRPVIAAVAESSAAACELRRAGGAGLRVDPGDPATLADAMVALQADTQQRRGLMGRTALRYARAQLGRAASMHRLELVVDSALAPRTISGEHVAVDSGADSGAEGKAGTSIGDGDSIGDETGSGDDPGAGFARRTGHPVQAAGGRR